jgi:hypothetical protein
MASVAKPIKVSRYVLMAALIALIPFALLKAFWPAPSLKKSAQANVSSVGQTGVDHSSAPASQVPVASANGQSSASQASASQHSSSQQSGVQAMPDSLDEILSYLNQHKTLAQMTDAKDLSLPEISKYARNQISFSYTDSQLTDYQYAAGNGTADYAVRQFQQIICHEYPAEIRQAFVQHYVSFQLMLYNQKRYQVLSKSFNPQHCPA